jgi:hypothetical protein
MNDAGDWTFVLEDLPRDEDHDFAAPYSMSLRAPPKGRLDRTLICLSITAGFGVMLLILGVSLFVR